MKRLRQPVIGLIAALASLIIIIGIIALVLIEGRKSKTTDSLTPTNQVASLTLQSVRSTAGTLQPIALVSPTPTFCPTPIGWTSYLIQSGDSLADLAESRGLSTEDLVQANCLDMPFAMPGSTISLPVGLIFSNTQPGTNSATDPPVSATAQPVVPTASPSATPSATKVLQTASPTAVSCQAPSGWVVYTVVRGDALAIIARHNGTTVEELQKVNCLGNSTVLHVGDRLYIPGNQSTPIQSPAPTLFGTNTPTTASR
jgi:LysM repeat protein